MKWKLKWKNDKNYQKPRKITGLKKIIYEFKTIYFKKGRKQDFRSGSSGEL